MGGTVRDKVNGRTSGADRATNPRGLPGFPFLMQVLIEQYCMFPSATYVAGGI